MKKLISLLLLISSIIYGQEKNYTLEIDYIYTLNFTNLSSIYQINTKLTFNNNESIYEMDHLNSFANYDNVVDVDDNIQLAIKSNENEFVFKSFKNNDVYYSDMISMKKFDIKSKLDTIMSWTLSSETKNILGYTCQKAVTEYGGRYYVAYFTSEIPIQNGPWRFHGLPGVILEVESADNVFAIRATIINSNTSNIKINNPFNTKTVIAWDTFLKIYKKKYDEVLRNSMSKNGPTQELAKEGIIVYIKD
ncbi:MAG: hypothetical protein DRI95_07795 [Bacteroidetes bacterium]|nr:MAG: hypothetical protein DRI95_07795 [Bacteroidota bacterium]